ncbi:MAG: NAD(P)H-quinone oxidoreductase [Verrucomicrobia bacterium]|nr:NAD(P)H-quinone oxidoreductase [Verrucomicrobiota bacterium]MBV9657569.1 NAD(P)H-quinone oxidoreductase [Verrucomicrobiota bacterium]
MRCVEIARPGPPDVLTPTRRAVPVPATGEVLIRVRAAGINRPDVFQRKGSYPPPPGASDIPGLEIAGTVVALGAEVSTPQLGDEVCALVPGGGYAEFCTAAAPLCLPVPRGLDIVHAAAIPETYFTVWNNVFDRGRLQPGESFLVHGGTSGIGTTAIALAKRWGATVFATAGGPDKAAMCERLGARRGIDYRTEDFVNIVLELTHVRGVDVILDMVGGDYFARNLTTLAPDGRLVQIAFLGGYRAEVDLRPIMVKRLTITGSTLRARPVAEKARLAAALREHAWPWLERGEVRPLVHATFPLEAAAQAQALMESSAHIGKIVLTI